MEAYYPLFLKTRLFAGLTAEDLKNVLPCLGAQKRAFPKGGHIFSVGERISSMALLLSGSVHIQKEDYWGNLSILGEIGPGDLFGETYACLKMEPLTNNAVAVKDCVVLFLDAGRMFTPCTSACSYHTRLIQNFLAVLASKNLFLTGKLTHMSRRTTREKLLSYLSEQSQRAGSPSFSLPFNRQQLADFLSVDRSALSAELGKMQREGLLETEKNYFYLKEAPASPR